MQQRSTSVTGAIDNVNFKRVSPEKENSPVLSDAAKHDPSLLLSVLFIKVVVSKRSEDGLPGPCFSQGH